eukprot:GHVR01124557.1.p1 GENE.GHVR01124557.1~~GHVR01124557.1.p1  ORF type:complete len:258 (+),score=50.66 GHVR01124557.1:651-1424(+)
MLALVTCVLLDVNEYKNPNRVLRLATPSGISGKDVGIFIGVYFGMSVIQVAAAFVAEKWANVGKILFFFVTGCNFGFGLTVGGMTMQEKIKGAFDLANTWDPSLWVLFCTALLVTFIFVRIGDINGGLLHHTPKSNTCNKAIDIRLVLGAAIFGVGWGMCGLCPGPLFVNCGRILTGDKESFSFGIMFLSVCVGMLFDFGILKLIGHRKTQCRVECDDVCNNGQDSCIEDNNIEEENKDKNKIGRVSIKTEGGEIVV